MWHFISEQISQKIGHDFICDDSREISSGDTHSAFRISDGQRRFFVKLNQLDKRSNFEAEAQALEHFSQTQLFKVPAVICLGEAEDKSFLVLEYITLNDGDEEAWRDFGVQLAMCHQQCTQNMYGWQDDNFIGPTIQPNQWSKRWDLFFAEQRIGFMLQLLAEQGQVLTNIDQAVDSVQQLLKGHAPASSMLHGDLWRGNTGFNKGQGVIFDPAFYFGDRETDIAMTELFSKFPSAFYQGYQQQWPLSEQYQYRKSVYQLYHILNHALLFGGQYLHTAKQLLKNI